MTDAEFVKMFAFDWETFARDEAVRTWAEQRAWILTAREAIRRGDDAVTTGHVTRFVLARPYTPHMFSTVPDATRIAVGLRADGVCEGCKQPGLDRRLHHVRYDFCGYELPTDVLLLCRDCHTAQHQDRAGNFWVHTFDRVFWHLSATFHHPEWMSWAERWLQEQRVRHELHTPQGKARWRERCEALWEIERLVTEETHTPLPLVPLFTQAGEKFALLSWEQRQDEQSTP
jgi:hypothetical protein